nr:MAG TPA: hypothetical protein [Caudoviricetes sp.]
MIAQQFNFKNYKNGGQIYYLSPIFCLFGGLNE